MQLILLNSLLPIAHKNAQIGKVSILKLEGIINKIFYERRDYESADEKAYLRLCREKNYERQNSGTKGLNFETLVFQMVLV